MMLGARRRGWGSLPFLLILLLWFAVPFVAPLPPYVLPTLPDMGEQLAAAIADGTLFRNCFDSLWRLAVGFLIGNVLALPLGIAVALSARVADYVRPVLTFLQSIGGIAWVPLAVVWFGVGTGAVLFVIANTIFFATIYNTVTGVQGIPRVLHRAVRSHGGRGARLLWELILPGALVQIIVGLRTSMAYGWRALVGAEMIAGTNGLGFTTMEAVQWYHTDTVLLGMIIIGCLWLAMDGLIFDRLERATVVRWGLLRAS
jgi:ABC-type nitrate/sulfonate/bicarbonate transport system permease component